MKKSISFVIITNNDSRKKIPNLIKSIIFQKIEDFEIIISGFVDEINKNIYDCLHKGILYVNDTEGALSGNLSSMRNKACKIASKNYYVILDDDMLLSLNWFSTLDSLDYEFDILTTCVKLPDGTRFWDKCCYMSPKNGHKILNYSEFDDNLYMSGGQGWIMSKFVFENFKWDESYKIYNMKNISDYKDKKHNEDTEYSTRCLSKYKILHEPKITIYHDDSSYTSFGRIVRRRSFFKDHKWVENINFPDSVMINFAINLLNHGIHAEAFDIIRKITMYNVEFIQNNKELFNQLESLFGDNLENSNFSFSNDQYNNIITEIQ